MSTCKRCGASFNCAMVDGNDGGPCWCTALPPAVPLPSTSAGADADVTCWCPACLKLHIEQRNAALEAQRRAAGGAP